MEATRKIFADIRDHLISNDGEHLKEAAAELLKVCKPSESMAALSSLLITSRSDDLLTSQDAIHIVAYLVQSDPLRYLKVAAKAIRDEAASDQFPCTGVPFELTEVLIDQLAESRDVEISEYASETLLIFCNKLSTDFIDRAVKQIEKVWQNARSRLVDSTQEASIRCVRCATATVKIACLGNASMRLCRPPLQLLLGHLQDASDPLLQMSMLDQLENLAAAKPIHRDRSDWLFQSDVVQGILRIAGGVPDIPPDPILGGPALRVVAALCKLSDSGSDTLAKSFHLALHNFEVSEELDRLALVDAISSFVSESSKALNMVLDDPVTREAWLSISVAQPKLKSAILISVAMVLDPYLTKDLTGDEVLPSRICNESKMKLFAVLGTTNGGDATELVVSLAKSALPETRLGAYRLLQAVAKLPMGGHVLFLCGGFYDFLLKRDSEPTKEGREAKYTLVSAVLVSEVKATLADEIVQELEKYVSEGAHYVKPLNWEIGDQ